MFIFAQKSIVMQDSYIFNNYQLLPKDVQQQVADYIDFLLKKYKISKNDDSINKKKSNFGSAKGLIVISDDFDKPIEEFHLSSYCKIQSAITGFQPPTAIQSVHHTG